MVKVSIICTNYNKGNWIGEAIESFLKQETSFSYEIIIVDDASTDNSVEIIRNYQKKYPDIIHAFFNEENKGITKTWISICKEAKGYYIARCDGDDYWTNPLKLQKQVELLESTPNSRWSNTDFDMVTPEGKVLHKDVLKNQVIPFMDSYEKLLAFRGMTMASTWLVERELMLEVNAEIADDTADDTFDIQLELFKRTELAFLPLSTTVYRVNEGSDSRPNDFKKTQVRFNKLLETQKKYVRKFPDSDMLKIIDVLLERNNTYELILSQQAHPLADLLEEKVTVYFADEEGSFSQENIQTFSLALEDDLVIDLPDGCQKIRVDLSEQASYYNFARLSVGEESLNILPAFTNGLYIDGHYLFTENDPQIIFELPNECSRSVRLHYQMITTSSEVVAFLVHYITQREEDSDVANVQFMNRLNIELESKQRALEDMTHHMNRLNVELESKQRALEDMTHQYNSVISSRRWTIPTKIINFFRRKQ